MQAREASEAEHPIVVLSADRPTALRGVGAPQTTDPAAPNYLSATCAGEGRISLTIGPFGQRPWNKAVTAQVVTAVMVAAAAMAAAMEGVTAAETAAMAASAR